MGDVPISAQEVPFQVTNWTGSGSGYMVKDGVCFSTFSYNTGTFIPISGLNERLDFTRNSKIYIEYTILPNLQVSGASVKCTQVGTRENWPTYPDMFYITPSDITDSNGRVTTIVNGKRQVKAYSLVAYIQNDQFKNGGMVATRTDNSLNNIVQILDTDLILLATVVSGVPVIFPSPFYGGTKHLMSIKQDQININRNSTST